MPDDCDDDFSEIITLIRKIADKAYKRGHDDALKRIVVAAQGELSGQGQFNASATVQHPSVQHPSPNGVDRGLRRPGGQPGMKRATRGSVGKYVSQVLADPHYQGATWEGIYDSVRALGGTDIAPASVRNYLRSSEIRHETRRQNNLWFLSRPPWAREGEDRVPTHPDHSTSAQQ